MRAAPDVPGNVPSNRWVASRRSASLTIAYRGRSEVEAHKYDADSSSCETPVHRSFPSSPGGRLLRVDRGDHWRASLMPSHATDPASTSRPSHWTPLPAAVACPAEAEVVAEIVGHGLVQGPPAGPRSSGRQAGGSSGGPSVSLQLIECLSPLLREDAVEDEPSIDHLRRHLEDCRDRGRDVVPGKMDVGFDVYPRLVR